VNLSTGLGDVEEVQMRLKEHINAPMTNARDHMGRMDRSNSISN